MTNMHAYSDGMIDSTALVWNPEPAGSSQGPVPMPDGGWWAEAWPSGNWYAVLKEPHGWRLLARVAAADAHYDMPFEGDVGWKRAIDMADEIQIQAEC